jgi:hypothetical protein
MRNSNRRIASLRFLFGQAPAVCEQHCLSSSQTGNVGLNHMMMLMRAEMVKSLDPYGRLVR